MLNAISAIELSADATVGEKLIIGLEVAAIGIVVVFLLLALLILVLKAFEYFFKKDKGAPRTKPAPTPVVVADSVNYDATVAAIVAALSVVLNGEAAANPNAKFIVKSVKKFQSGRF